MHPAPAAFRAIRCRSVFACAEHHPPLHRHVSVVLFGFVAAGFQRYIRRRMAAGGNIQARLVFHAEDDYFTAATWYVARIGPAVNVTVTPQPRAAPHSCAGQCGSRQRTAPRKVPYHGPCQASLRGTLRGSRRTCDNSKTNRRQTVGSL